MKIVSTLLSFAAGLALLAGPAPCANAQSYPSKPVRLLVGFPPGGGTDILARLLAKKLSDTWGQPVLVDNRAGASATIASDMVAKAPADGYTISMGQLTPNAIAPALIAKMPYDAKRDLVPVVLVGSSPNVLVTQPGLGVASVPELVALAKSRPGKLTYASSGPGSLQHIAAELFRATAGVEMVHVPYKGSSQALVDLMSGQVDLNFDSIPPVIQHVKAGKLRPVAVTAAKRASALPDLPAIAESPGFRDYDLTTWWGLFTAAGTPEAVVARINRDTNAALRDPELRARFAELSVEPGGGSPQEFAAYVAREMVKYEQLVKTLNIKAE
jgi:tripartite-type tricarboxylate transporter receptor subunit TctC